MKKMSKSLGNYIGVNEPPNEMFGKLMSISDKMMADYYVLLLGRELPAAMHPLEAKKQLAREITATYHTRGDRKKNLGRLDARFSEKKLAEANLPEFVVAENLDNAIPVVVAAYWKSFGIAKSRTEVRRFIQQGSVQLDGEKITDPKSQLSLQLAARFCD